MAILIRRFEREDEVDNFDCGRRITEQLRQAPRLEQSGEEFVGVTYVAVDEVAPRAVLCYFTLATASVPREAFPKK